VREKIGMSVGLAIRMAIFLFDRVPPKQLPAALNRGRHGKPISGLHADCINAPRLRGNYATVPIRFSAYFD
jgi:hypothetical protein